MAGGGRWPVVWPPNVVTLRSLQSCLLRYCVSHKDFSDIRRLRRSWPRVSSWDRKHSTPVCEQGVTVIGTADATRFSWPPCLWAGATAHLLRRSHGHSSVCERLTAAWAPAACRRVGAYRARYRARRHLPGAQALSHSFCEWNRFPFPPQPPYQNRAQLWVSES